jgi:GAF domain-containing protein
VTVTEDEVAGDLGELTLEQFSEVARALRVDGPAGLTAIVTQATIGVPQATWAGLIELERDRLVPRASLGDPPQALDKLQQELAAGPCFDAARRQEAIVIDDTATEDRWPDFAAAAVLEGVNSMLCVPLWVDQHRLGTLSLYAQKANVFGDPERRLAAVFATLAALALADNRRAAQFAAALQSRDIIGQAKGILMERMHVTADAAFDMLVKISQKSNEKLVTVAERLVAKTQ